MIIGVQIGSTSGCAVYEDGKVIYAASEERFTRKKNDSGYPINAINSAIKECHITSDMIEKIVLPTQNMTPMHFLCDIGSYSIQDRLREQKEYYKPKLIYGETANYLEVFYDKCSKTLYSDLYNKVKDEPEENWADIWNKWRVDKISKEFGVAKEKVCIVNHEYSHAAYGLYGSKFTDYENVMTVVYDGFGDESNASIYVYNDGQLQQIKKYNNFNIGRVYRYITLLLGMKPDEHEFKVMGLAPYANEYIYREPLKVFREAYKFENGNVIVNPELKDNYFYFKEKLDGMRFDGIAAGLQIFTEEMSKQLIEYWINKTEKKKCVISGGVSLNIKANMEIGKMNCINDLFVVGSSGDESLCIGAIFAYLDEQKRSGEIQEISSLYLGDEVKGVKKALAKYMTNTSYEIVTEPTSKQIAKKIADGYILGRVSGKMEFGARALGNRSILADPRKQETVTKINNKIKSRDFWMPFTPSILAEDAYKYLDNEKNFSYPFMSVACESTNDAKKDLKAAIHPADYTIRPQLVTKEMNSLYYELIRAFKEETGVGALLNTSLNIHGYPIVRTAEDAMEVLEKTDLDGMIFDEYMILKVSP